jgi:hypothetical protein
MSNNVQGCGRVIDQRLFLGQKNREPWSYFARKTRLASLVEGEHMVGEVLVSTERSEAAHEFSEVKSRLRVLEQVGDFPALDRSPGPQTRLSPLGYILERRASEWCGKKDDTASRFFDGNVLAASQHEHHRQNDAAETRRDEDDWPVFSSSVIICCQRPALDTGKKEPSELLNRLLDKVWLFEEIGRPVAGEDPCCRKPLRQHVLVFQPIDADLFILPYPRIRVRVKAMDGTDIDVCFGLALGRKVDLLKTDSPDLSRGLCWTLWDWALLVRNPPGPEGRS